MIIHINIIILFILKIMLIMVKYILFHPYFIKFFINHFFMLNSFPFYYKSQKIHYFYDFLIMIKTIKYYKFIVKYLEIMNKFIYETFKLNFKSNLIFLLQILQIIFILFKVLLFNDVKQLNQVMYEIHNILLIQIIQMHNYLIFI